jgi:hypothetical protein
VSVNIHYCGGKFKSISLYSKADESGCCGHKEEKQGCCDDKTEWLKIKDDHQKNFSISLSCDSYKVLKFVTPSDDLAFIGKPLKPTYYNYHSPPFLYEAPLYLRNKVLLI